MYGPRARAESKLEPFKAYLQGRLQAGVWNAAVLLRELRERNYGGGYTILTDWLQPQRKQAESIAVRRFETPPGKQAQVDWGATIQGDAVAAQGTNGAFKVYGVPKNNGGDNQIQAPSAISLVFEAAVAEVALAV